LRKRQAFSLKGIKRRLADADLARVADKRRKEIVTYDSRTISHAVVLGIMAGQHSTRGCEALTAHMSPDYRKVLSIPSRIADNTLGSAVAGLSVDSVGRALVRLIKTEHRRGNLKPDDLGIGTIAIDGKNVATLHFKDLLRLCKVENSPNAVDEIAKKLKDDSPWVQLHRPDEGEVSAVIHQHNVALVSSKATGPVLTRPLEGSTNEIGALPDLLDMLHRAYAHTRLFSLVTTDAGNTSAHTAMQMRKCGWHYFLRIKGLRIVHASRVCCFVSKSHIEMCFLLAVARRRPAPSMDSAWIFSEPTSSLKDGLDWRWTWMLFS